MRWNKSEFQTQIYRIPSLNRDQAQTFLVEGQEIILNEIWNLKTLSLDSDNQKRIWILKKLQNLISSLTSILLAPLAKSQMTT